jgi:glycoside hydrolase-like protein
VRVLCAALAAVFVAGCASVQTIPATQSGFSVGKETRTGSEASEAYLGFDRNEYPGDAALPMLRKSFEFSGYWLGTPPGEKTNSWRGKHEQLRSQGFGFLLLYRGRQSGEIKNLSGARQKGSSDAHNAAAAARSQGFPLHAIIFLDIEEGGRLSAKYHFYLRVWADALTRAGFRPGVYCSGIPVDEGGGASITTADDIRDSLKPRPIVFWVYNDACPPSAGCATPRNPPKPAASGISYAAIWQFAQSPRRREFTRRCAATYRADGNCYAPGDATHAWHLDIDTATSPDPSGGRE